MHHLGIHMSIAGGCFRAVERAAEAGYSCVQLFTKNNNRWQGKELTDEDVDLFKKTLAEREITHPIVHNAYLINLASPDDSLWGRSVDAMFIELVRADRLGIPYVITHPGSFTSSSEEAGISRIATALDELHERLEDRKVEVLLETTAGQGSNLGWRFEQLQAMIEQVKEPERVGICLDTCHVFAAGYPLAPKNAYDETMGTFDELLGIKRLKAFHLNDSKQPFGSRKDRHEGIGQGELGFEPFRLLLNDPRVSSIPMYLETPKGEENGEDLDRINLARLLDLIEKER
ncbi:Endonuclease IV [Planctomycetales bacterium 10988]|nr:Endonuclease IV [Planctomycetales bacterium 10988]